jgi:hypothetical protein
MVLRSTPRRHWANTIFDPIEKISLDSLGLVYTTLGYRKLLKIKEFTTLGS